MKRAGEPATLMISAEVAIGWMRWQVLSLSASPHSETADDFSE